MAQSQNEIKFLHFREPSFGYHGFTEGVEPRGGITVAFRENADGTISHAEAICSDKDNFVKAAGRALAAGRLDSDHKYSYRTPGPMTEKEFAVLTAYVMEEDKGLVRKYSRKRKSK